MERLKSMKENLMSIAQGQMGNLHQVDTHELGEVIDMIKDLEEALYYCSITKAMEESQQEKKYYREHPQYYMPYPPFYMEDNHYKDNLNKMYYQDIRQSVPVRDGREGRSAEVRKNYMEAKQLHQGKEIQMKELDRYMTELTHDIAEMIQDASPEEKSLLQQKIATLATKIK